jgi:uncharacterized delta-60 repeat protein
MRILLAAVVLVLLLAAPAPAAPGDLDLTFSDDGRQLTDFGGDEGATSVALQADGRIVAAGGRDGDFALARYLPNGVLDPGFGTITTDFGASESAWAVAVQVDGRIVVAGSTDFDVALARYEPDGSLDASFAGDGTVTTDFGGMDGLGGMALQPDGRIVVAGWRDDDFALARYHADGSLDTSFSADGILITDVGGIDQADAVAIQPDGKIVAAGGSMADFAVVRYEADGALDPAFAGDGTQHTDFGGGASAHALAIGADGRIVAGGSTGAGSDWSDVALARYRADGSLDPSFGTGGRQTTDIDFEDSAYDVALQDDGRIIVAGTASPDFVIGRSDFAVARYGANGQLDTGFAGDGIATTDFSLGGPEAADWAGGLVLQADGRIVVAGGATGDAPGDFALARYDGGGAGGAPPSNAIPPTIAGSAVEGQVLSASAGTWTGSAPIGVERRWRRCDEGGGGCIAVATTSAYTLTAADVGRTIRVRETATNAYGTATVDSPATAVVKARPGGIAGAVRRSGNGQAIVGATVTCGSRSAVTSTAGRYSITGLVPASYQCTASASKYMPSTRTVTVTSGSTAVADFNLVRR